MLNDDFISVVCWIWEDNFGIVFELCGSNIPEVNRVILRRLPDCTLSLLDVSELLDMLFDDFWIISVRNRNVISIF